MDWFERLDGVVAKAKIIPVVGERMPVIEFHLEDEV